MLTPMHVAAKYHEQRDYRDATFCPQLLNGANCPTVTKLCKKILHSDMVRELELKEKVGQRDTIKCNTRRK